MLGLKAHIAIQNLVRILLKYFEIFMCIVYAGVVCFVVRINLCGVSSLLTFTWILGIELRFPDLQDKFLSGLINVISLGFAVLIIWMQMYFIGFLNI